MSIFHIHFTSFSSDTAQRLAAQLLGRLRFVVTILAGKLKQHIGVHSLSLGQVSCSRVLGAFIAIRIIPLHLYSTIRFQLGFHPDRQS
jgi:aromatic ring-cleaving dioxygenase